MNIVVVGGGLHGWLTAMIAKRFYTTDNVTVIASDAIGILGVGEGTTPGFIQVLDYLHIPVSELVKECNATIKLGIDFINWNGDGKSYFHGFSVRNDLDFSALDDNPWQQNGLIYKILSEGKNLEDIKFTKKLLDRNSVPWVAKQQNIPVPNPIDHLEGIGAYALHIEARSTVPFLERKALERGIEKIEGIVESAVNDENGYIKEIVLEDGRRIAADFVFDCSGFARLILGKHYGVEWTSYSDFLPLTKALAFQLPHDNSNNALRPCTDAVAMDYGWMWRVPVQNRYGYGYVFAGDMITDEQALAEAERYVGRKIETSRVINYKPGCFSQTLHKNAMAVGIAQTFVEPLEATTIWVGFLNTLRFVRQGGLEIRDPVYQQRFNERCANTNKTIVEFLYLHYLGQRQDTEFWRSFRTTTKYDQIMARVDQTLKEWEEAVPVDNEFFGSTDMFYAVNWIQVLAGLGLFTDQHRRAFARRLERIVGGFDTNEALSRFMVNQEHWLSQCWGHKEFLEFLKRS